MKKIDALSNSGINHTYFEVSAEFLTPLVDDYFKRRVIKNMSQVIDPLQKEINNTKDFIPIGTKKEIEYIFRGKNVVNPKKLWYYSKTLNIVRFPNIGEYYKGSTFVD